MLLRSLFLLLIPCSLIAQLPHDYYLNVPVFSAERDRANLSLVQEELAYPCSDVPEQYQVPYSLVHLKLGLWIRRKVSFHFGIYDQAVEVIPQWEKGGWNHFLIKIDSSASGCVESLSYNAQIAAFALALEEIEEIRKLSFLRTWTYKQGWWSDQELSTFRRKIERGLIDANLGYQLLSWKKENQSSVSGLSPAQIEKELKISIQFQESYNPLSSGDERSWYHPYISNKIVRARILDSSLIARHHIRLGAMVAKDTVDLVIPDSVLCAEKWSPDSSYWLHLCKEDNLYMVGTFGKPGRLVNNHGLSDYPRDCYLQLSPAVANDKLETLKICPREGRELWLVQELFTQASIPETRLSRALAVFLESDSLRKSINLKPDEVLYFQIDASEKALYGLNTISNRRFKLVNSEQPCDSCFQIKWEMRSYEHHLDSFSFSLLSHQGASRVEGLVGCPPLEKARLLLILPFW